jgi:hypothetical protein
MQIALAFRGEYMYVYICIYIYILSQERCVPLKATKETGLKLNMDIAKHILHELDTKLKSA